MNNASAKLRFLHLSDIHFGQEKSGAFEFHEDIREELLVDCQMLRHEHLGDAAVDAVLLTGDIAQSGKEPEFKRAAEWLERLTAVVGCDRLAIRVVPGNHDVDLSALDATGLEMQAALRTRSSDAVQAYLDQVADTPRNPLAAKFADYLSFAGAYGSEFESFGRPLATTSYKLSGGKGIRMIGMCSVMVSDKNDRVGDMFLGKKQYVFGRDKDFEDIVMMHHPVHWLKDRDGALPYLNTRARILMTGHEHNPDLCVISRDGGWQQIQLAAGALNPPAADALAGYTYNWLELFWTAENARQILNVVVFPRKWNPALTRFDPDYHRTNGKISCHLKLDCGAAAVIKEMAFPASDAPETAARLAEVVAMPSHDCEKPPDLHKDKELLHFLFWRFLDRKARQEVLAALGLMEASSQPLPTAFERAAFELADERRLLHALWDATAERLPPEERRPNPFPKEER